MKRDEIIKFLRQRDYRLVRELGEGACGKTVLLADDLLNTEFVCKKFSPLDGSNRAELFNGFVRETKILHLLYHENVVRVFTYYLYPDQQTGYILMEHVDGTNIESYVRAHPELINELFEQAVAGFRHLECNSVLHRDIRIENLMVTEEGRLKILDFGFGKTVTATDDFDKSISLNLWCEPPTEYKSGRYDFRTEVYFLGRLFEQLITENGLQDFKYQNVLDGMCTRVRGKRTASFADVEKTILSDRFTEIEFGYTEQQWYLAFANEMSSHVTKVERSARYHDDPERILLGLEATFRSFVLERIVPDSATVIRHFINGSYYLRRAGFEVSAVRDFIKLLRDSSPAKRRIIISNLQTRLDALPRYTEPDDEIPF